MRRDGEADEIFSRARNTTLKFRRSRSVANIRGRDKLEICLRSEINDTKCDPWRDMFGQPESRYQIRGKNLTNPKCAGRILDVKRQINELPVEK
jgi:hypothetical protein